MGWCRRPYAAGPTPPAPWPIRPSAYRAVIMLAEKLHAGEEGPMSLGWAGTWCLWHSPIFHGII